MEKYKDMTGIIGIGVNKKIDELKMVEDRVDAANTKKLETVNTAFSNMDTKDEQFYKRLREFVDIVFLNKGEIYKPDFKNSRILSDAIECLERAKFITKKLNLKFEQMMIDEIRDTINRMERLSLLEATALLHISDLVYVYENEELEEEDLNLIRSNFRILKEQIFSEFENDEWK